MLSPDQELVDLLRKWPALQQSEIAAKLGRPLPTVRKQLARLQAAGIIEKGYRVLQPATLLPIRAIILVDFELPLLKSRRYSNQTEFGQFVMRGLLADPKLKRFNGKISIERVEIVLGGQSDVFIVARFADQQTLGSFVIEVVRYLPGVKHTHTATLLEPIKS